MNRYFNIAILSASLATAAPVFAQSDGQWNAMNLAATDQHVIPAYQTLAESTAGIAESARDFCADPAADRLAALKQQFHVSMDAWQAIEHVQFGPITYFNWNYRIHYWPDANGTGERQLTVLLAERDEDILPSESFARMSVGVQGFPALERLLFSADSLESLEQDSYRCQFMQTITRSIHEIADGVAERWPNEYRDIVLDPSASSAFEGPLDLGISFLKTLLEPITKIRDQKLAPVIGESFAAARDRRAESWRSERSLRNIEINLVSMQRIFSGIEPGYESVFLEEDAEAVNVAFRDALALLENLPDSMVRALAEESTYEQVVELHAQVDALHEAFETGLKNTDLYLGFNSLDGD